MALFASNSQFRNTLKHGVLLCAFAFGAESAACSRVAPRAECAAIDESQGGAIARAALLDFIRKVQDGKYGGSIGDGGKVISAERIGTIRPEDLIYSGIDPGEHEGGEVYTFKIAGIDEITFYVKVYPRCGTRISWRIA